MTVPSIPSIDIFGNIYELARTHTREEFQEILAARDEAMRMFLAQYQGPLSLEQIHEGIVLVIENAESLLKDTRLLFDNERWPRSFSLSISALEEAGKVGVLHAMAEIPSSRQKVWVRHWRDARRHHVKTAYAVTPIWHDQMLAPLGMLVSTRDIGQNVLERLRQSGLYVDFRGDDRRWQTPVEVVREMAVKQYEEAADSIRRTKYYQERGLFEIPLLQKLAAMCRPVYDNYREIPAAGEQRTRFFLTLMELREKFFNELVEEDILYLALFPEHPGNALNESFLQQAPNKLGQILPDATSRSDVIRVIDTLDLGSNCALTLSANAIKQNAVCFLERNGTNAVGKR